MDNKKILWVNPSFLDYRVPLYTKLKEIYNGNFYLIYSKNRIPARCHSKIINILDSRALFLKNEKSIKLNYNNNFANRGLRVPLPTGLYKMIKSVRPNIILAEGFFQFTPWAVWYSFIHRIPLLVAYERTAHTERNCPWWRRLYRRFIGLFVNGYIANGQLTKDYLISQGVKPKNIFTGGMCADSDGLAKGIANMTQKEKADLKQEIIGKESKGLTYIFVGQMIPRKGVKELLYAWNEHCEKYTEDKLLLVGNGTQSEELKEIFTYLQILCCVRCICYPNT